MKPPNKLSIDARKYWRQLDPQVASAEANIEPLCRLCVSLSEYWLATALIAKDGITVNASTGGTKRHPAIDIKKIAESNIDRLEKRLGLEGTRDTEEQDELDDLMGGE